MDKKLVIIESPYAGDFKRNEKYARRCMLDSFMHGEVPFVSHLLYTQVLDDTDLLQRKMGMEAGFEILKRSDFSAVYKDYGISEGMAEGIKIAEGLGHSVEYRRIGQNESGEINE